ncbi:VWA domain-containing protein [[Eubacterium] cellulosolvens]
MKDKIKRVSLIKIFLLVSVLILSGLSATMAITGTEPGTGMNGLIVAGKTTRDLGEARQAGGPLVESVQPASPITVFVGEQDVTFNLTLRSLFTDDDNDQNGDNVLYNISIIGTNPSADPGSEDNLMKFDYKTREFKNVSTPIFKWATRQVVTDNPDLDNYLLYSAGNYGPWKYVVNASNRFLDENNNGMIDTGEYWSVRDGDKTYGDFMMNILGDAEPGYYRMKLQVSYEKQETQEVNTSGVGNSSTQMLPVSMDDLFLENEALGPYKYYYWVPWDKPGNSIPSDLDNQINNLTGDFDYHKQINYAQSQSPTYNNIWEAIPDDGTSTPTSHPDINGDTWTSWLPSYNWAAVPYSTVLGIYTSVIIGNYPTPPIVDQPNPTSAGGFGASQGNGTWTYHGRTADPYTNWGSPSLHTDEVWFDFIINSTVFPDEDLNEDNETNDLKLYASDDDYYTNSLFEEFYIMLGNIDPNVEMRDVYATLYAPTLSKGGFSFYMGKNEAYISRIAPFENVTMNYRLAVDAVTPPGYYWGAMELRYTKRYQTSQVDPLGNPLTVDIDVIENHWVVRFMVDYTPELGDAKIAPHLSVRAIPRPNIEIDTSVSRQIFDFTVKNTGNVILYGGNMTEGNLHMNFAEFRQMGDDYYDADADPGIVFEPIDLATLDVGQEMTQPIELVIPNHWYLNEGIYRLYLNYTGYYFDDGALGDPSGFKYMEMNWVGFNDDGQPRDCYVYMDKNDNESASDPQDAVRAVEGMYTDIYIKAFDPTTKELAIIDWSPKDLNQEMLMGGSYDFNVTFQNQQSFDMYNVFVEFDIEGYFDESYYYDWTTPTSRMNPKAHIDHLAPDDEWTVNFTVDDLDKLLPQGEHHIPVKYSYDYDEYQGVDERTTFGIVWDTSGTPFKPYIDANNNFMLNKGGGGTRGAGDMMDIIFVMDDTYYASSNYFTRSRDAVDDFVNELTGQGIDYQMGIVAFRDNSWLVQDLTSDPNLIKNGFNSLTRDTYNDGVYDAVMETLSNSLTAGGSINYRPGATTVIVLITDYYPNQGTTSEISFGLACKGECMLFVLNDMGYLSYYDDTVGATGGQMFNVYDGNYIPHFTSIAQTLGAYQAGVTPGGARIYDVPLDQVADPESVDLDTYGPYIIVNVQDTALDIEPTGTPTFWLGGDIRNLNVVITLNNHEYVQYTDIEIYLPLIAKRETMPTFENPANASQPVKGKLSSTTLAPNGGTLTATFNVDLNVDADSGVFEFELDFRAMNDYTKQLIQGKIPVTIRVYPKEPILIIPQLDPVKGTSTVYAKNVKPGDSFTLTFTIQNIGEDTARDVYITLSNEWYENAPFTTIDAFVTSVSSHSTSYYQDGSLRNVSRVADTKLEDLGISKTSDIIDAERQLLAPTAVVPRTYISEIRPGETINVSFRLRADTHMVLGRPYREYILVEYIDSDGLVYGHNSPQRLVPPIPITIHTKEDDSWARDETTWSETLAILLIIIIVIIIIVLLLSSVFQRRKMGPAERYEYREEEEEFPPEEEEPEEEFPEEEEPEDLEEEELEEEKPKEEEPEWAIDEEEKEEEELEEEEEDDWAITEEETKKPAKGKMPVKGKAPGKAPAEDEDIDDWE